MPAHRAAHHDAHRGVITHAPCGSIGRIARCLTALWIAGVLGSASASEYGIGTYRPGQVDLFAGLLGPPGTAIVKDYFLFQNGSESALTSDRAFAIRAHTVTYTEAVLAFYVTRYSVLGASLGFGTILQARIADQTLHSGPVGLPATRRHSVVGGFGDLIVVPLILNWHFNRLHVLGALGMYAPTGSYDRARVINIGLNRWSIEPDVGVTWLDDDTGQHFSLFAGYTINAENPATHYRSGDEFHIDFVLAQHMARGWVAGITGYAVQQTTADSGSGDAFGAFRGRVFGLGPLIGKTVKVAGFPINISIKYDFEFAGQNRVVGDELWLMATFRF